MLFLILSLIGGACISLSMVVANARKMDADKLVWVVYTVAGLISLGMLLAKPPQLAGLSLPAFGGNLLGNITPEGSLTAAIIIGILTGVAYLSDYMLVLPRSIAVNGPSATTMFGKLGVLIPVAVSIFLWKEMPAAIQWAGIVLAIFSLIIFNYNGKLQFNRLLMIAFFTGGMVGFTCKLFAVYSTAEYRALYLLFLYLTGSVISAIILIRRGKFRFSREYVAIGIVAGICNFAYSFFILKALDVIMASIVYPVTSAGMIMLVAVVSFLFFKDRLGKKGLVALVLIIISLILINL